MFAYTYVCLHVEEESSSSSIISPKALTFSLKQGSPVLVK